MLGTKESYKSCINDICRNLRRRQCQTNMRNAAHGFCYNWSQKTVEVKEQLLLSTERGKVKDPMLLSTEDMQGLQGVGECKKSVVAIY